jgi:prefoldin subunit 5
MTHNFIRSFFQDDVDTFMQKDDNENNVEKVLKGLDEQHSKYKFMEFNIAARKRKLKQQIPDLGKSLNMIKILTNQNDTLQTQVLLSEQVFVKTSIPPTKTVCLWLGANVMLEYPLDEAETLLKQNMDAAAVNLKCLEHDQEFLRDQLTTTEVNMARVYNWDVKRRQSKKPT